MPLLLLPSEVFSVSGSASGAQAPQTGAVTGTVTIPNILQTIIPSYAFQQYSDDPSIAAFIASYNTITQGYLNWFNQVPLAVYSNPNVAGPLLNWVGAGIYGIQRPVFSSLVRRLVGGLNSKSLNGQPINGDSLFLAGSTTIASDDYYKRVLTWWIYPGDGRRFSISFLRLKIARFLYGVNGGDVTLSQSQNIFIQAEALGPPPRPVLSVSNLAVVKTRVAGVNATAVNAAAVNGGKLHTRSPFGGLAGVNAFPLNGIPVNGARIRKIAVYITYVTAVGETLPSTPATIGLGRGQILVVYSPPSASQNLKPRFLAGVNSWPLNRVALGRGRFRINGTIDQDGVIGWNVYIVNERGIIRRIATGGLNSAALNGTALARNHVTRIYQQGIRQNVVPIPIGTNWTEPATGFVRGATLPTKNTSNVPGNLVITLPTGQSSTYFQQALEQGLLAFPLQLTSNVVVG